MPVHFVPEGYHSVTPYLVIDGAARAMDFYRHVFGAVEIMRMPGPDGKIGHAEMMIGDSHIMLADEHPEQGFRSPTSIGGTGVGIMIYVQNADDCFAAAVERGAKVMEPPQDKFYGDRSAQVVDPFGHFWTIATHVEDVPPDEMERRAREFAG
ncbi:MAG TPA: VOC family protein [Thermoanaerobaculia bacterium]|nr:VOC family protein [Thermoanaerobaculia bacterium]